MEIRQLKYFVSIVEEGSYSAAAKKHFITQPALSKSIKNLENELGIKLFFWDGHRNILSDEGSDLYRIARRYIEEFDDIHNTFSYNSSKLSGTISIGIPPMIGTTLLPNLLYEFTNQYPRINLQISQQPSSKVESQLIKGELNIGFSIEPINREDFDVTPIARDLNVVIVNPKNKLASRSSVTYADLEKEKFILWDSGFTLSSQIINGCSEYGYKPNTSIMATHWDFIVSLVKANMGISIIPRRILEAFNVQGVVSLPLNHRTANWNVVMLTTKSRYQNALVRTFCQFTKEYFEHI